MSSTYAFHTDLIKRSIVGSLCLTVAYAILVTNPLQMLIDDQLSIHRHSFLYNLFKKPPLDVYITVKVFSITNADRFMEGIDKKLSLQEVGPFVFLEILEHRNTTFNANGTLRYVPIRTHKFMPELSIGNLSDFRIFVPNIPLLGVSSLANKWSMFAAFSLGTLAKALNLQPILNLTVEEYLWGYEDPLVKLGSQFVPNFIDIEKFGLLERMMNDGHNVVGMHLPGSYESGASEVINVRDFSIDTWNGHRGLNQWHFDENANLTGRNTACNTLRGTYDGTLFPKGFREDFLVYRKAFCRTLKIRHSHSERVDHTDVEWFRFDENAFVNHGSDPNTNCFCENGSCLKKGLGDISPCYYNIPIAVSMPHFLNSDPSLLENIDGLKPTLAEHDSWVGVQPQFGVPMTVRIRVQVNLVVEQTKFNSLTKPFDGLAVPLLWLEISTDSLPKFLRLLYHLAFNILPWVQHGLVYFLFIFGVSSMLLTFAGLACLRVKINFGSSITPNVAPISRTITSVNDSRHCSRGNFIKYTAISFLTQQPTKEDA